MSGPTFRDLEHSGWLEKAAFYDDFFAMITQQAIEPLLSAFGDLAEKRLLDVGCGTGHLAGAAAARGADAEGLDFAAAMVTRAGENYPDIEFREGDAQALPYDAASFDAVACSFGLLHLDAPAEAVAEAARVLKPGGKYALTVWCGPDQGGDFFALAMGAVAQHGRLDVALPPAPPMFGLAEDGICPALLSAAGFSDVQVRTIPLSWSLSDPKQILGMIYKSIVRLPMVLQAQTDDDRGRIHDAILTGAEAYRKDGVITFAFPALLTVGRKAA